LMKWRLLVLASTHRKNYIPNPWLESSLSSGAESLEPVVPGLESGLGSGLNIILQHNLVGHDHFLL